MQDYRRGHYDSDDRRSRGRFSSDRQSDPSRYRQDSGEQRFRGRDDRGYSERYRGEGERSWRDQGDGFAESRERYEDESQFAPMEPEPSEYSSRPGGLSEDYDRRYGRDFDRPEQDRSGSRYSPSTYYGGYRGDQGGGMHGGQERGRRFDSPRYDEESQGSWRSQGSGDRDWQSSGRHQTQAVGGQQWSWGDRFGWNTGQQSYAGKGPKNYQRSDDRIREEVSDRLTDDPRIDASNIEVEVRSCEVTLSGTVNDREQKRRAEDLAESITGVKEVTNNIRLARQAETADQPARSGIPGAGGVGSKSKPTVGA
jgi:hypothetical protein